MREVEIAAAAPWVLLVEDDSEDARLLSQALRETRAEVSVERLEDGSAVRQWIRHVTRAPGTSRPDLVVLDLHLPDAHGVELLREMREHPALRALPVVVLTSSEADRDVDAAWNAEATTYYVKPANYDEYLRLASDLQTFWMASARAGAGHG